MSVNLPSAPPPAAPFSLAGKPTHELFTIGDKNLESAAAMYGGLETKIHQGEAIPPYELMGALRYCNNATSAYRNAAGSIFATNGNLPYPMADANQVWVA